MIPSERPRRAARRRQEYVRCLCDHPGDTPACPIDHDQIQHEVGLAREIEKGTK